MLALDGPGGGYFGTIQYPVILSVFVASGASHVIVAAVPPATAEYLNWPTKLATGQK